MKKLVLSLIFLGIIGGIPLDIEWIINTIVWKEYKNKLDL